MLLRPASDVQDERIRRRAKQSATDRSGSCFGVTTPVVEPDTRHMWRRLIGHEHIYRARKGTLCGGQGGCTLAVILAAGETTRCVSRAHAAILPAAGARRRKPRAGNPGGSYRILRSERHPLA